MGTGGGGGAAGGRTPSWKERENNRRRERRRRAISANIFSGLRAYGNYSLPKHCDNNQVLIALCHEAGWTVEPDGTTYRKGRKPPPHLDLTARPASLSASPSCSSYQPSPYTSFNPSPGSSSLASPASSSYAPNPSYLEGGSLIPWLKNLSSSNRAQLYTHGGSISAPVTPPGSSPSRHVAPDPDWWGGTRGTHSPTFSLVSAQPLGCCSSQMLTPLQSGTCSPAVPARFDQTGDVPMSEVLSDDFAFRSGAKGVVKAWEGERIHEDCSDDLELTLGCAKTR
ncbi:BES1/BZR1 homolog protein 4-like [Silene latifolia]|uniref:BES1/BZR1 homolog protein 4-like n=1 Tax=Silene latifolia TaxID=37657 RepID=UPI003D78AA34